MGVEYAGFCHSCKKFIDCHKCYAADNLVRHAQAGDVPTYSDFSYWCDSLGYWGSRLVWFMLRHAGHETEVLSDHHEDERYFDLQGQYEEVAPYAEMEKQREALPPEER